MSTIKEALENEEWEILGKLASKRIFFHKVKGGAVLRLLILVFVDKQGEIIEVKSWGIKKAYCVYRKVDENATYLISGSSTITKPNQQYSTAKYEVSGNWWVELTDPMSLARFMKSSSNLQQIIKLTKQGKPVNLHGTYVEHSIGPGTLYFNGKPSVQGYFVKMLDDHSNAFVALVWHTTRLDKSNFPLFKCQPGDSILIYSARESNCDNSGYEDLFAVTTTYQLARNSECIRHTEYVTCF